MRAPYRLGVWGLGRRNRNSGVTEPGAFTAPGAALLAASLALVLATGCKPVGPDYKRPEYQAPTKYKETGAATILPPPSPVGGSWQPANPSDGMLRGNWWEIYQDPQLNRLEDRVEANNPSLPVRARRGKRRPRQLLSVRLREFLVFTRAGFTAQAQWLGSGYVRSERSRNRRAGKLGAGHLGTGSTLG
jgi:outer membrane protein TolC